MGLCESVADQKNQERQQSYQKTTNSYNNQIGLESPTRSNLPHKYETVIISDNLKTIAEESTIPQDRPIQYQSTAPSPLSSLQGKEVSQQVPLMIHNPSSTWNLQSHIIKQGGLYEVSVAMDNLGGYDEWEFICDHSGVVANKDRVILRHLLTDTLLIGEENLQNEWRVGSIPFKDIVDEGMWQIETSSDTLYENCFISNKFDQKVELKHIRSRLYLSRNSENASMDNHRKVNLSKFDPINSFWLIKLK